MPVPVSPKVGPGLTGGLSGSPLLLITPPHRLRDHVEREIVLDGLPSPKPSTWP